MLLILFGLNGRMILLVTDSGHNMADKSRGIVEVQIIHDRGCAVSLARKLAFMLS